MTKIVKVGKIPCGADPLFLIAGPCVIEDEPLMMKAAETLKGIAERLKIGLIFKSSFQKDNRSSLKNYPGPGLKKGVALLGKIKKRFGLPLITDIHYPDQAEPVAEVVDVLQIPAYLCMQSTLMVAAAKTGRAINIKHGQFLSPDNMKYPLAKCVESGNDNVILTERGYSFGYNDLVVDPRSFYHLRALGYPTVFDVPHAVRRYGIPSADPKGGNREFLPILGRVGIAAGVDGLFIETHPDPNHARCDAASQLPMGELEEYLKPLLELHAVEVRARR